MPTVDLRATAADQRILAATRRCIARWGVAKTTLDDVAGEAGCSRATIYRLFPGGKDSLLTAFLQGEVAGLFGALRRRLEGIDDLEELVVAGITEAARQLAGHDALQFLLAHEPEVLLPRICFHHMDGVLRTISEFVAPYLAPHVGADEASRAAEWLARMVLSYTACPAPWVDVRDEESVRRLVRAFVLPGLVQQATLRG